MKFTRLRVSTTLGEEFVERINDVRVIGYLVFAINYGCKKKKDRLYEA